MIAPRPVDMQAPAAQALLAEPEFLHYPPAGVVLRPDGRLDPVQPDHEEAMIHGHGQRSRGDAPTRVRLVDPVTHLRGPGRSPHDAADGELPGEVPAVRYDPGHGQPLAGLPAHRARHGDVRAEAGPV